MEKVGINELFLELSKMYLKQNNYKERKSSKIKLGTDKQNIHKKKCCQKQKLFFGFDNLFNLNYIFSLFF